jgi:hypothetical protein
MEELYHAALGKSGEEREALLAESDPEVRRALKRCSRRRLRRKRCWIVPRGSRPILPYTLHVPRNSLPVNNSVRIGYKGE